MTRAPSGEGVRHRQRELSRRVADEPVRPLRSAQAVDDQRLLPPFADELDRVVAALATRYPDVPRDEIARVVDQVHHQLSAEARVSTHLIPLTLNLSRRRLQRRTVSASADVDALARREQLDAPATFDLDGGCPGGIGGDNGRAAIDHQVQAMAPVPE